MDAKRPLGKAEFFPKRKIRHWACNPVLIDSVADDRDHTSVLEATFHGEIHESGIHPLIHYGALFRTELRVSVFTIFRSRPRCERAGVHGRQWPDQPLKLIEFPRRLHAVCWTAKLTWKWPWGRRSIAEYLNGWAPWDFRKPACGPSSRWLGLNNLYFTHSFRHKRKYLPISWIKMLS